MVRLNRIYTRTGDDGTTALVGGERVDKDDLRIEAYGTVDELNACIGLVRAANQAHAPDPIARAVLDMQLEHVQQTLFNLGSGLATRMETRWPGQPVVVPADVTRLEQDIDSMNAELHPLTSFVLPGGGPIGAAMHLARTVCRRAERRTVELAREEPLTPEDVHYLNRLSDWLFVAGRWAAHKAGEPEALWTPGSST